MYFELIIFTLQNYRHSPTYKTTQNSHFYVRNTRKARNKNNEHGLTRKNALIPYP